MSVRCLDINVQDSGNYVILSRIYLLLPYFKLLFFLFFLLMVAHVFNWALDICDTNLSNIGLDIICLLDLWIDTFRVNSAPDSKQVNSI